MGSVSVRRWATGLGALARESGREPIIVVLFLSGVFTVIAGSDVDGGLLLAVAAGRAWDGARSRDRDTAVPGTPAAVGAGRAGTGAGRLAGPSPGTRGRRALAAAGIAGGVLYAVVIGSFARYSWPATAAVAGVAAVAVGIGWRGQLRQRPDPGRLPARGAALWGGLLVTAGIWELVAYFQQPTLTEISYQHPTISALTDPLLASHLGRSAALAAWLLIGWFLAER